MQLPMTRFLFCVCSLGLFLTTCSNPPEERVQGEEVAILETSEGEFIIEFYPTIAPQTVANFKKLAREGFYNGTYFHRVVPGLVIQGGDPNTKDDDRSNDGAGGPGYTIPAEFSNARHVYGTVSMWRRTDPSSHGSQFLICLGRLPSFNGKYTVFGKVIRGMATIHMIQEAETDTQHNPIDPIYINQILFRNR